MAHALVPVAAELARLAEVARTPLAVAPTPLLPAPHLASVLGARVPVSVKADAWTGFGLGGNKVRKLEYELAPERLTGITRLVTAGGPHSNHCRVTAAAAARLGLKCTLVVNGAPEDEGRGNARLHRLLGARIVTVRDRSEREGAMAKAVRRARADGGKALLVPVGASTSRGALGYVHALTELHGQLEGADDVWVFCASSSGGTMAGLILGCAILGWRPRLVAVSADEPAHNVKSAATSLATAAARLLTDDAPDPADPDPRGLVARTRRASSSVVATDAFVGAGYGCPTPEGEEAAALFASRAGFVLDPVYTAKAAAALIAWLRDGKLDDAGHVVFLHTGGHPALFR